MAGRAWWTSWWGGVFVALLVVLGGIWVLDSCRIQEPEWLDWTAGITLGLLLLIAAVAADILSGDRPGDGDGPAGGGSAGSHLPRREVTPGKGQARWTITTR
jgi:hypothetical protein